MLKKISILHVLSFALLAVSLAAEPEHLTVEMSQDYGLDTSTIKTSLDRFFKPLVIGALERNAAFVKQLVADDGMYVTADFGTWDGMNSFETKKAEVNWVRENIDPNIRIKIVYSDLNANPPEHIQELIKNPSGVFGENVEVFYVEHNFYAQLPSVDMDKRPLPTRMHMTTCTLGTHWLSEPLKTARDSDSSIFPTKFKNEAALQEVKQKSASDLRKFMESRLHDSSLVALSIMVQSNGDYTAKSAMDYMDMAHKALKSEHPSLSDGYVAFYYQSVEEFLHNLDNLDAFTISHHELTLTPCDYVKRYEDGKITKRELAIAQRKMTEAWGTGSIVDLVGSELKDKFFEKVQELFESQEIPRGSVYHLENVVLRPTPTLGAISSAKAMHSIREGKVPHNDICELIPSLKHVDVEFLIRDNKIPPECMSTTIKYLDRSNLFSLICFDKLPSEYIEQALDNLEPVRVHYLFDLGKSHVYASKIMSKITFADMLRFAWKRKLSLYDIYSHYAN